MKRYWARFEFVFILCVSLFMVSISWAATNPPPKIASGMPDIAMIQKRGELRVAFFKDNNPPFFMHDDDNHWSGIEIDLATLISQQLQVKLTVIPADSYDNLIDMVANGQADIGMGLVSMSLAREMRISFTNPYYIFKRDLLVNRVQAAANGWNIWQVVNALQTTNKPISIGALGNSAQINVLHNLFPNAKIVSYPTVEAAMQAVAAGKVFAALGNSPVQVQNFLEHTPKANLTAVDVSIPNVLDYIAAAVPWQYFYLREWLNVYFDYLSQNGIEAQIFQKYNQAVGSGNVLFQLQ